MSSNLEYLEEELFLNEESGEWETRLVDKREKKEVIAQQKELNKQLESNFYFPYKDDVLETKRIKKDLMAEFEYEDTIGLEFLSRSDKKLYNDFKKRKDLSNAQLGRKRNGGRMAIPILEKDIRYSMSNSNTVREAANFLHVSRQRWMKYAGLYIDTETGLTLYQLHLKNCWGTVDFNKRRHDGKLGEGFFKRNKAFYNTLYSRYVDPATGNYIPKDQRSIVIKRNRKIRLYDVLQGMYPLYDPVKLKRNLINAGWFEAKCSNCNYETSRPIDNKIPLVLNFKDGNSKNHLRDNLEMLCFNCFFIKSELWKNKKYYSQ